MNDGLGMVGFLFGLAVGVGGALFVCIGSYGDILDARCATACAPLVGDDREAQCQCATSTGWKPITEVKDGE